MPLQIVRNDITKMECDAIVNAANTTLLGGGGVDGAIHRAAGKELLFECMKLHGCKTGNAKITGGYKLPSKHIIHTVGPVWRGGGHGEKELLTSCYRNSLRLAKENNCESVAFPLISSGIYGYPKDKALRVAVDTITEFLAENEMLVYIVIFDKKSFDIGEKLFADISSYIDDHYVEAEHQYDRRMNRSVQILNETREFRVEQETVNDEEASFAMPIENAASASLEEVLGMIDESFSEMLMRKIDEKGMKDSDCYKKANIDRKLFSKIRSNKLYKPSKQTAVAFAIALELPLAETKELLMKAGFALSHSSKSDIIIEYFIANGIYDIFVINEALFSFDQKLLGV
ncbi:MAG: O-acetyl-ADP-ribose deacetylase [Clostridia bacterium]|nr:O-acetyl-ADP-ribose deacetylase [Clostridia bacterium]